jgi:hypothetical protein
VEIDPAVATLNFDAFQFAVEQYASGKVSIYITTGGVTETSLGANSVTSAKVVDGTLTDADVAAANKDGAAGTASLRTLGTAAGKAAAGTHATQHQHGGADEVATATPGANAIPKADGSNKLAAGWLSEVLAFADLTGFGAGNEGEVVYRDNTGWTVLGDGAAYTVMATDADGVGRAQTLLDNNHIAALAGIVYTKLNLSGSIVHGDIAAANKDGAQGTPSLRTLTGPAAALGTAAATGSSQTAAPSDHVHAAPSVTADGTAHGPTTTFIVAGARYSGTSSGTTSVTVTRMEATVDSSTAIAGTNTSDTAFDKSIPYYAADALQGRSYNFDIAIRTTVDGTQPTGIIRLKLGGVTVLTIGTFTLPTGSNAPQTVRATVILRRIGGAGTAQTYAFADHNIRFSPTLGGVWDDVVTTNVATNANAQWTVTWDFEASSDAGDSATLVGFVQR